MNPSNLPCDLEAEHALLGALMLDPRAEDAVDAYLLPAEAFYDAKHRAIYAACLAEYEAARDIDERTLAARLRATGDLERVGGSIALAQFVEATPTAANLAHYVEIVREQWRRRALYHAAMALAAEATDQERAVDEAMEHAAAAISDIQQQRSVDDPPTLAEGITTAYRDLRSAADNPNHEPGITTGFADLDYLLGGWQRGHLIVIAARPSMGKSALMAQTMSNAARRCGKRGLVFSLEMEQKNVVNRIWASEARVDLTRLRRPAHLTIDEWTRLSDAGDRLRTPLLRIDSRSRKFADIRARCRLMQIRHGLDIVAIDYLQLCRYPQRDGSREREIAEISRGAKELASDLEIPVILLSQLNRSLEQRQNKRPMLSDLRESGAIEQDADVILFPYREHYYDSRAPENEAEIICGKQRDGPTGVVKLHWEGIHASFRNATKEREQQDLPAVPRGPDRSYWNEPEERD